MWKGLLAFFFQDVWAWIALLYGLQCAAAAGLILFFGWHWAPFIWPLALLLLGCALSLVFRKHPNPFGLENWTRWVPLVIYAAFIFLLSHNPLKGM
ncbi:MAG: hypothetical protein D6722_07225, partial [Bacteroidetes bacterium]